jgi:sensor c-di-GMP phosphodiesterase-like protein
VSPKRKLLVAIVAGVVLAGPPVAAFNFWLNGLVERQSLEEMESAARRSIVLAESRIGRTITILTELANRGIDSCRPTHVDTLRQATFATTPVKEISVLGPDGRTLCTDIGNLTEQRRLLSSEPLSASAEFLLEVIRIGERPGQWVRIRRPGGTANGLAALIPSELFFASTASNGRVIGSNARLATRNGTLIGEGGARLADEEDQARRLLVTQRSERYALSATVSLPRASVLDGQGELRAFGTIASGLLAVLILVIALMLPKPPRENPIAELESALEAGEFVPYYQPVVDIRSGRLRGAEVLIRWRKPDGTIVLPAAFIPLAESSGLIIELTRTLMRRVCQEMGPTLRVRPHLKVGFNLTARHFADEEIVHDVRQIFTKPSLPPNQVVLEVTERQPLENLTETRRVIAALQGIGVRIAIDDVGTGHSGLSYMLKLGVDIIKIDKMFIDAIGTDRNSNTIIETLIDLARNMRMDIVAEGVETFEQVVHLRELGIRAAQGYVFAPPLPGSAFMQLIEAIDPLKQAGARGAAALPLEGLPDMPFNAA